jgi:hypothetical protein
VIGVIFLAIVLLSPGGLMGILGSTSRFAERAVPWRRAAVPEAPAATGPGRPSGGGAG